MEVEIDQGKTERRRGRPKVITNDVAMRICDLLANGRSLRKIASMRGMPARSSIQREVATNEVFSGQYRRARAMAGDTFADKVIEVADATLAGEHDPNAARVAIRTYQWTAGKLNSAEYGDHQRLDVAVTIDATEHAPDWIKRRLAPVIDAEVTETEAQPTLADTSQGLVGDIEAAAAGEVTRKGE